VKAWQAHELGEPRDVLALNEVPEPEPGPGQVLVRVRAAAANFPDVLMCRGEYQVRPPLPFTPGIELCGEIVAVGPEVEGLAVGDRVLGGSSLPGGAVLVVGTGQSGAQIAEELYQSGRKVYISPSAVLGVCRDATAGRI